MGIFPINHMVSFDLGRFVSFFSMCSFLFKLQSMCSLKYFTTSVWRMIVWFILTTGQWPFWRVGFMCDDLNSLNLVFHFISHFSIMCKCSWRLSDAITSDKICAVKLEEERTLILIPSVSAIVLEVLVSLPWQWNTNKQTNNALFALAN